MPIPPLYVPCFIFVHVHLFDNNSGADDEEDVRNIAQNPHVTVYNKRNMKYNQKNYDEAFKTYWGQYYCAKQIFGGNTKMIGEFSDKDIIIESGSSFGRPYAWIWLWGKKDWYWLGYRIDHDNNGYFISLRLYRECRNNEKIYDQKKEMYENMKSRFDELYNAKGLEGKLGGNKVGYNESEIGKFYFHNNDVEELKKQLYNIAKELILSCVNSDGLI